MTNTEKINAVMQQTGADEETAKAALKTSDGDVDIAVRIIQSYNMKGDASNQTAGKASDKSKGSSQIPEAKEIIDAIKEIWKKGNASRLDIEKDGRTVLSISLTIGTIGLVLAPVAALIGIGAALITEYTIKITMDNGTVINVNEFAVTRKASSEPKQARDVTPDDVKNDK